MDDNEADRQGDRILELEWRVAVLERAVQMLMATACAKDDLLGKRFNAEITDLLEFLDKTEMSNTTPEHRTWWRGEREFIRGIANDLLPPKDRGDPPPSP